MRWRYPDTPIASAIRIKHRQQKEPLDHFTLHGDEIHLESQAGTLIECEHSSEVGEMVVTFFSEDRPRGNGESTSVILN